MDWRYSKNARREVINPSVSERFRVKGLKSKKIRAASFPLLKIQPKKFIDFAFHSSEKYIKFIAVFNLPMRRFFLFFMLLSYCAAYAQKGNESFMDNHVRIKIPAEWIEKVRHYKYNRQDTSLLVEFERLIAPKTLDGDGPDHNSAEEGCVFDPMFANLDGAAVDELICFLGWDDTAPYFTVFKKISGAWYLVYLEEIHTFYDKPFISVAGNFSTNKIFYFRHVDDHGSGVYTDSYSFYRLINNRVYNCLNIVNEAHIYGWGLFINQEIKARLDFSGGDDDYIAVDYDYNFFAGAIDKEDSSWCAHTDIPLIKGDDRVYFEWDKGTKTYRFQKPVDNNMSDLTARKIACFGDFGNDTLFVRAFRSDINETLKSGTLQQKKILRRYLTMVKQDKKARTEELEEKSNAGGTKFYGPKKKQ